MLYPPLAATSMRDMVDRKSRDMVFEALTGYMEGRFSAFRFDDLLEELRTKDETLTEIRLALWFHYDDCKDHQVVATREQWQWFNRMRLFLLSDSEMIFEREATGNPLPTFTKANIVAIALLVAHSLLVVCSPKETYLLISVPTAILTWVLVIRPKKIASAQVESDRRTEADKRREQILPFKSFGELLSTRRRFPEFHPLPYKNELVTRKIRSKTEGEITMMAAALFLALFPALPLLLLSIPSKTKRR